jgi:hypothetical protein
MSIATSDPIGPLHAGLQQSVFDRYDVLVCPTMADTTTPAEGTPESHAHLIGKVFTCPFNLLSRHPVLAVPSGLADNGVPTGVQIVGRTFDEPTSCASARPSSTCFPGPTRGCRRRSREEPAHESSFQRPTQCRQAGHPPAGMCENH